MPESRAAYSIRITGLGLCVAAFAVFFLLPLTGLFYRAAGDARTVELLSDSVTLDALRLSVVTASVTVLIAVLVTTPIAYLLARRDFPGRPVVEALIDLPIVLPPTVAGVALLTAFGRRGLLGEPIESWTGFTFTFRTSAVVMAQLLVSAPLYLRAVQSGFELIDRQHEQVAYTLGASPLRAFFRVVLPQIVPTLAVGMILCWTRAIGELGATLIFAGNLQGETQTMPLAILGSFESADRGLDGAVSLSVILIVVAFVAILAFRTLGRRVPARAGLGRPRRRATDQ
jgi:molybdate transport system permease protein